MAPSTVFEDLNDRRDGSLLEEVSDAIDEVNVLKYQSQKQPPSTITVAAYDEQSQFDANKDKTNFRQYETANDRVKNFYREQHTKQTVAYNLQARAWFDSASRERKEMSIWEAMEVLNSMIDESDPDTSLSQLEHLLQTAECIRRDGKPRWMQVAGLVHDLGKLVYFLGGARGQWDVVGDTFAVGLPYDERIIYGRSSFAANEDYNHPVYSKGLGIYEKGCGLENVMLSWGHDEYLYRVLRDQSTLPAEALAMIRYHSFYPWHREGAYFDLMCEKDHEMLKAVRAFNPYDLYSKSEDMPSAEELKPYYMELIGEYFPEKLRW